MGIEFDAMRCDAIRFSSRILLARQYEKLWCDRKMKRKKNIEIYICIKICV